jgi:ATP-dependent Lon protease
MEEKEERLVNKATVTADDYTIFIPHVAPETREEHLREYFARLPAQERVALLFSFQEVRKTETQLPHRFRVLYSRLPLDLKRRILAKMERQQDLLNSGDAVKHQTWVEHLLSVPIDHYVVPQKSTMTQEAVSLALKSASQHLDEVIFGHRVAKQAILERLFLWMMHPYVPQRPLALLGCPGNGKTTLIREGLSVIMGRPFNFVALGGSMDSSYLVGHGYTYEGSLPGRIVESLASSKCMNPVVFFDELDKCSATAKGEEIINVLVHLTDITQSANFRDRYLGPLDLDLSRSLMVFAFNDASKVSPVLMDRFQVVKTDSFDSVHQATIMRKYLLPRILADHSLPEGFVSLSDEASKEIVNAASAGGVRLLRSVLERVVCKVNIYNMSNEASLMHPLRLSDVRILGGGSYEILGGLKRRGEAQEAQGC